ncbi:uncharacterized protein LOC127095600 [Lathyrus oleraceus]|uniref:uncharacterized protein LOC127095600 n=1 Tax=Pisum sativum TaxID=3888 RepID=UPI0021D2D934|nr:uncharacterized protein LOC127095600 [Pisum sativum]
MKDESMDVISKLLVVCDFTEVFLDDICDFPPKCKVEFTIYLVVGTSTMSRAPYQMSAAELSELKKQLKDLIEKKSFVRGFCLGVTIKNKYQFSRIEDLMGQLVGVSVFNKINLHLGYHQICVKHEDILMSAFRARYGHYEYSEVFAYVNVGGSRVRVDRAIKKHEFYM